MNQRKYIGFKHLSFERATYHLGSLRLFNKRPIAAFLKIIYFYCLTSYCLHPTRHTVNINYPVVNSTYTLTGSFIWSQENEKTVRLRSASDVRPAGRSVHVNHTADVHDFHCKNTDSAISKRPTLLYIRIWFYRISTTVCRWRRCRT